MSSRIQGGWCLIPRIDQKVDILDTVIQQVFSTSVPLPLPMMEDDVAGSILKSGGQKEYDEDPPLALWYSWFYSSWKSNRSMVHSLAVNWQ